MDLDETRDICKEPHWGIIKRWGGEIALCQAAPKRVFSVMNATQVTGEVMYEMYEINPGDLLTRC